jgi:hypothetical protein
MNVDRILAAVGHWPDDLDRAKLTDRLNQIAALYRAAKEVRTKPAERQELATKIIKRATELRDMVETYLMARKNLGPPQPHSAHLDWLIHHIRDEPLALTHIAETNYSANQYLVSTLAKTFKQFFHESAGYTRNDVGGKVDGPCIDFVAAVLEELKASISRESIAKFLWKSRKG